jgi:hypothetical protein
VGDQAIHAVRTLAEILEEEDGAAEVRQVGRADEAREDLEVPAIETTLDPPGNERVEPIQKQPRGRVLEGLKEARAGPARAPDPDTAGYG